MARAAIREHHRRVPVNTARVTAEPTPSGGTSPVTGFAYLDSVLDQPGSVIAMAHRGGALHPEIPGAENTLHAFRHAVHWATTTSRPTCTRPVTVSCWPSTTPRSTASPTPRDSSRG